MARLLGPDQSTRLALRYTSARQVEGLPGKTVTVYTDQACTTLASIAVFNANTPTTPGSTISGSKIVIGQDSVVPLFWFPDGYDTLWALTRDGHKLRLLADLDGRLDTLVMSWNGTAYVPAPGARIYVGPNDPGVVPDGSVWIEQT